MNQENTVNSTSKIGGRNVETNLALFSILYALIYIENITAGEKDIKRTVRETDVLVVPQPQAGTCGRIPAVCQFSLMFFIKDIMYKIKKFKKQKKKFLKKGEKKSFI